MSSPQLTVPVVDFGSWKPGASIEQKKAVAAQIIAACKDVGFVYLINHAISPQRLAEAFAVSKRLYDLPLEKKKLAPHPPRFAVHRGYSWPGLEKVSNAMGNEQDRDTLVDSLRSIGDVKESYEIGSEHNVDQPNQWLPEDTLPGFRKFTTEFYWECHRVAEEIMSAMALGIGLEDEDFFRPMHPGHNNQLRLLHYPPVPASLLESKQATRLDAHSDWPSITLLFQDDCGGLQIENPNRKGDFLDVPPLKDAVLMNLGDLMMRWTNDTLKSTLHRVGLPPKQDRITGDERITRERYSIPYFVSPNGDTVVKALPPCIDEKHPEKYEPIRWNDYMLMRASMQYT